MAFSYTSTLPKNISEQDKRDKVSSFECDIDTIKGYLVEIANTYLLVAYRIYEINRNRTFKYKYKNIVEACQSELGFKKSTTYNMINIVERFGKPDSSGFITYNSLFGLERFSYSQLCEMLSLSDRQRLSVTPDMTVKDIRSLKKSNPGDNDLVSRNIELNRERWRLEQRIKELESKLETTKLTSELVPVQALDNNNFFQTSGKKYAYDLVHEAYSLHCSRCHYYIDIDVYDEEEFITSKPNFCPYCGSEILDKTAYLEIFPDM